MLASALSTPRSGSASYITRQMIPDERMAMAAGMKITRRNALFQLTLSESTASTRPIVVTSSGKATTEMTLLKMAVRIRSNRNICW